MVLNQSFIFSQLDSTLHCLTNHLGPVSNRDGNRSVIFSDGIRPGDENSHLDGSDTTPSSRVRRRSKSKITLYLIVSDQFM